MSDTSIISTRSSYDDGNNRKKSSNHHSSFCNQYWFHIFLILLLLIIFTISSILIYILYKQLQRNQERRRIQNEFKRRHGVANKVLDLVTKDGLVAKWLKTHQGSIITTFRELMTDMVETVFDE
ncbi:unnamed protein product [Adineta steineri]|uniref:Uncharacterized protein n=1 Tax=Adineta steineri TaxID=433720 RepID=A0A818WQH6_9BILA|nr:unnamed protein product [Adineta steineri]CAF3728952.1 unnamed protein product [Adineta steineri]